VAGALFSLVRHERAVGRPEVPPAWRALVATPGRAAAAALIALLLAVSAVSARTVPLLLTDASGERVVAHCGVQYFVFGAGDSRVQHACRNAYGGHALVLFPTLLALGISAGWLLRAVRRDLPTTGGEPAGPRAATRRRRASRDPDGRADVDPAST
jgi:hypothetical protein